jgi:hypothetical protein
MNSLQKMIVLTPSLYERLKNNNKSEELIHLSDSLSSILKNKKITKSKKWYLLRQKLMRFADKKRHNYVNHHYYSEDEPKKYFHEASVQASPQRKKHKQTSTDKNLNEMFSQTTPYKAKNKKTSITPKSTSEIGTQYFNPTPETFSSDLEDDEDEIIQRAASAASVGAVLHKRKSLDKNKYHSFTTDAGDVITVPVIREEEEEEVTPKKKSTKKGSASSVLKKGVKGESQSKLNYPLRRTRASTSDWTNYK